LWFRDQAGSQAHACNALEQGAWALDAFSAAAPGGQWAARATLVRRRFLHETSWGTVADAREAGPGPPRRCSKKYAAGNAAVLICSRGVCRSMARRTEEWPRPARLQRGYCKQ